MSRLGINRAWLDELSPEAMYEHDFENLVRAHIPLWFPQYYAVRFWKRVPSDEGPVSADLALVERRYREWWVLEIELASHSFEGHVLPQVRRLSRASYGRSEALFLLDQSAELDQDRLLDMVKGHQPRVLVIVNATRPEWALPLARYDARLLGVRIFRSSNNDYAFLLEGDGIARPEKVISECSVDPMCPSFVLVDSPAALDVSRLKPVDIEYKGACTSWKRVDSSDRVWLVPQGPNPLKVGRKYTIIRLDTGVLQIQDGRGV